MYSDVKSLRIEDKLISNPNYNRLAIPVSLQYFKTLR